MGNLDHFGLPVSLFSHKEETHLRWQTHGPAWKLDCFRRRDLNPKAHNFTKSEVPHFKFCFKLLSYLHISYWPWPCGIGWWPAKDKLLILYKNNWNQYLYLKHSILNKIIVICKTVDYMTNLLKFYAKLQSCV